MGAAFRVATVGFDVSLLEYQTLRSQPFTSAEVLQAGLSKNVLLSRLEIM